MNIWLMLAISYGVSVIVFAILWVVQKRTGDAGIVDVAWGMGVGLAGAFFV